MKFITTRTPTELRAVATIREEWVEKANLSLKRAEEVGTRTNARSSRLNRHEFLAGDPQFHTRQEIKHTIFAAEAFRISGEHNWYDSAKAYAHAATLYADAMQDSKRAAELFTEAGIAMEKVDTNFSNDYYRKAISNHCDASQYRLAAMLQERIAKNYEKKMDFEAAVHEYKRSSKLYTAANMSDMSDCTLERAAYLLGTMGNLSDSANAYEHLAVAQMSQNMKQVNAPESILRAGLLLLSNAVKDSNKPDFTALKHLISKMNKLDCRFGSSRESNFLTDIIHCVLLGDLDAYADCLHSFDSLWVDLDDLSIAALEGIKTAVTENGKQYSVMGQGT